MGEIIDNKASPQKATFFGMDYFEYWFATQIKCSGLSLKLVPDKEYIVKVLTCQGGDISQSAWCSRINPNEENDAVWCSTITLKGTEGTSHHLLKPLALRLKAELELHEAERGKDTGVVIYDSCSGENCGFNEHQLVSFGTMLKNESQAFHARAVKYFSDLH